MGPTKSMHGVISMVVCTKQSCTNPSSRQLHSLLQGAQKQNILRVFATLSTSLEYNLFTKKGGVSIS